MERGIEYKGGWGGWVRRGGEVGSRFKSSGVLYLNTSLKTALVRML